MTGIALAAWGDASADMRDLTPVVGAMRHRGVVATQQRPFACAAQLGGAPVFDEARLLVADARLDNAPRLARELRVDEPEILLAAYRRWGSDMCRHLRGDFAFVIVDEATRCIFCARDPFGARPLYYHHARGRFVCASEPAALTRMLAVPRRPNLDQVAMMLAGLHNESDETVFDGVRALPGGHHLTVTPVSVKRRRFWKPDPWRQLDVDLETGARMVREQLAETVRRRSGNADVAIYLSGGLDSAVVAAEVARQRQEAGLPKPTVVHAALDDGDDETFYSDSVADKWGLPRINTRPLDDPDQLAPVMTRSPDLWWDPRLGMWEGLCAATREAGLAEGLTGDGVDECLRGTGSEWADELALGRVDRVLRSAGLLRRPWSRSRWRQLAYDGVLPWFPALRNRIGLSSPVLTTPFAKAVADRQHDRVMRHPASDYPSLVARDLCSPFEEGDTNLVLAANERIGAHAGIRIRDTLMDVDLVELLLSLPHSLRHTVGLDKPKPVLRRAMAHILPRSVVDRTSSGGYVELLTRVLFGTPVQAAASVFSDPSRLEACGVMKPSYARRLRDDPSTPPPRFTRAGWSLQTTSVVAMEILLRQL